MKSAGPIRCHRPAGDGPGQPDLEADITGGGNGAGGQGEKQIRDIVGEKRDTVLSRASGGGLNGQTVHCRSGGVAIKRHNVSQRG